jgi:lipopolysaccharide assembly outer membrane protein LptD (OstA)
MRIKFFIYFLLPILLFADERLRLVRADILENITENGTAIQILSGDVIFKKGNLTLFCDVAHYTENTEQGFLIGNARAENDSTFIIADTLHFDSPNDLLTARNNAHAWDYEYDLTADRIIYYTELDSGNALGNVLLKQKDQDIIADTLIYSDANETAGASYTAIGNVVILSNDRTITCGRAHYDFNDEIAHLTIEPEIVSEQDYLQGDELFAHFKDDDLEYLFIPSGAKASSINQNKTLGEYKDDMTGSVLKAYLNNSQLDSMRLEGMATTLYHVFEDSLFQGTNTTSGDTITLNFKDNELHEIFVIGGARGEYSPDTSNTELESEILYRSEQINYLIPDKTTKLLGEAHVDYNDISLSAGYVGVNWQTNILNALPRVQNDTTFREITPTLQEGDQEPITGGKMQYNLQTERGKILHGKTKAEDGYYRSSDIRNENRKVFYMKHNIYTTCSLDTPHFHFSSPRMKMIHNDKVVAKPLTLHIAQIPILSIPFAVLPMKQGGRQSGWIMPSYGTSTNRGHYLDGFGYYWAFSEYFDSKLTASFADKQGITFKLINKYNNRYKYSGKLHLETRQYLQSNENDIFDIFGPRKEDYVFKWTHKQILRRNQSLNVNASYYSNSNYNYATSLDPVKRMDQQAISNATYSKQWPKINASISLNLSSKSDLMADRKIDSSTAFYQKPYTAGTELTATTTTLPTVSFRLGQRNLIPTKSSSKAWFNNITWNYSSNFKSTNKSYYKSIIADTTGEYIWETNSNGEGVLRTETDRLITHSISLNAPQKIFRYITLNPSLSIKSDWTDEYFAAELDSFNAYQSVKKTGFAAQTTGSLSMSLNTQFYGLFPIKIAKINGLRHVATPSIGYSYTPDFSKSVFGWDPNYFSTLIDSSGEEILHDKFKGTTAGSTPMRESQSLNFSLNNVFQTKIIDGEQERKIDIITWRVSTNYNFAAEEFKLANMTSSIRTGLSKGLRFDVSLTHDFYEFDEQNNRRINTIRLKNNIPKPRLTYVRASTGFKFSGKRLRTSQFPEFPDSNAVQDTSYIDEYDDFGQNIDFRENPKQIGGNQLWSTNVSLSYSYNASNPTNISKTFWMNTNTTIQVTPNWRVQHNARFDMQKKTLVNHSFSIYRDLHCWEMSLSWTPSGYGKGVYLRINVKSPTLKDLKIEDRDGIFQRRSNF